MHPTPQDGKASLAAQSQAALTWGCFWWTPPYWAPHPRVPGALLPSSCSRLPWGSGVSQFPAQEGAVVLPAVAAPASSLISPMIHSCFSLVLKRPIAGAILSTRKDICAAGSSHHSPLRIQLRCHLLT